MYHYTSNINTDFGIAAQLYQALIDPTAGSYLLERADAVVRWIMSMLHPKLEVGAKFETWETLEATLKPFIKNQIGNLFLKWSNENQMCFASNSKVCKFETKYGMWENEVGRAQKYQVKSLNALRAKFKACRNHKLDKIMMETCCFDALANRQASKI